MKWINNTHNPYLGDAKERVRRRPGETKDEALERFHRDMAGKIVGEPKATDTYSVDQLRAMSIVGIYALEE